MRVFAPECAAFRAEEELTFGRSAFFGLEPVFVGRAFDGVCRSASAEVTPVARALDFARGSVRGAEGLFGGEFELAPRLGRAFPWAFDET